MAGVTARGVAKSFGDTTVLRGVDIEAADGEFVTLVGPSGCGKSTLLRIIAGLETADAGSLRIGERDVTGVRAAERNLSMVFQSYALYPHLTVAENMLTPLRLRDLSPTQRLPLIGPLLSRKARTDQGALVRETAEILKIDHLLDRKPGQLSGGQRQRAALGRAMVRKPAAFLMDEPLSNLDAALRVHMRAELAQLHKSLGATFIYVTHDQAEALTMSDKVAVMMGGRVLQVGAPDAVYGDPSCIEVAGFIGSPRINLLPAETDAAGRLLLQGAPCGLALPGGARKVVAGMRPEHLRPSPQGPLRGRVAHRENFGADIFVHLGVEGVEAPVVMRVAPELALGLEDGAEVAFGPAPERVLCFDPDGPRLRPAEAERRSA